MKKLISIVLILCFLLALTTSNVLADASKTTTVWHFSSDIGLKPFKLRLKVFDQCTESGSTLTCYKRSASVLSWDFGYETGSAILSNTTQYKRYYIIDDSYVDTIASYAPSSYSFQSIIYDPAWDCLLTKQNT